MNSIRNIIQQCSKRLTLFNGAGLVLVVLLFSIIMSVLSPSFLTVDNIESILLGLSVEGIMTIGMVILLISGGFDLSVGSTLGFTGVVTALSINAGMPIILSILLGLTAAALVGLSNGALISKFGLDPFIVTLGMMMAIQGLTLVISQGTDVLNMPSGFTVIGQGTLFGVQYPIFFLLILVIIGEVLMRNLRFFRQNYYVGGNESAARLNGINVTRLKLFNYTLMAILAGLAGIFVTARFGEASVSVGQGMELNVLTAAIIGGASLSGGEGSVIGGVVGALFMQILSTSLNLLSINIYWQNFITGSILVAAVLLSKLGDRRRVRPPKTGPVVQLLDSQGEEVEKADVNP